MIGKEGRGLDSACVNGDVHIVGSIGKARSRNVKLLCTEFQTDLFDLGSIWEPIEYGLRCGIIWCRKTSVQASMSLMDGVCDQWLCATNSANGYSAEASACMARTVGILTGDVSVCMSGTGSRNEWMKSEKKVEEGPGVGWADLYTSCYIQKSGRLLPLKAAANTQRRESHRNRI
jgi:hypothetical protein